jgi:hypothetical protein
MDTPRLRREAPHQPGAGNVLGRFPTGRRWQLLGGDYSFSRSDLRLLPLMRQELAGYKEAERQRQAEASAQVPPLTQQADWRQRRALSAGMSCPRTMRPAPTALTGCPAIWAAMPGLAGQLKANTG